MITIEPSHPVDSSASRFMRQCLRNGAQSCYKNGVFNFGRSLRHHLWEMFQYCWTSLLGASSLTRDIFRKFDRFKNNRILTENAQTCETWQIASQYDAVMQLHGCSA